ncbi:diguanylate cyclase domain-containing protein [Alicyclobacillus mengziensis]|uniref:Diguanylate cyclase n=1 Tax=Alicyclobacillus mengziensis TaxID=2931921 RepID=A0A9X7Z7C7_9BACL|nr:diguanylate cyclase [Alicyclobacillus mengziensis]QSO47210.1 diguanylate cyclase [Alicyclobacillus mengziensis]
MLSKDTQQAILRDEEIYRLIMEHSRDLIRVIDTNFNYIYVSPSHETLLGYTPDEMIHTSGLDILHPDDKEVAISMHRQLVSNNISLDGLFHFQCKNGKWVTLETRGKTLIRDGEIVGVVTIGRDVTEKERLEKDLSEYQKRLEFLAFHDSLTRLPNRTLFFERSDQAIKDAKRNGYCMAILFLDCDDFKNVNDAFGHYVGDEVMTELGRRISISVRNNDTVARLSGDEFTVLLPYIKAQLDVEEVVNRILESMNRPWRVMGNELTLTVSIGAAIYPVDGVDTEALIQHADSAVYRAKKHGKNTYMF